MSDSMDRQDNCSNNYSEAEQNDNKIRIMSAGEAGNYTGLTIEANENQSSKAETDTSGFRFTSITLSGMSLTRKILFGVFFLVFAALAVIALVPVTIILLFILLCGVIFKRNIFFKLWRK